MLERTAMDRVGRAHALNVGFPFVCVIQDKVIGNLRRKVKQLEVEKTVSDGQAADARVLTHEMTRLQRQVHEMEVRQPRQPSMLGGGLVLTLP